MKKIIEMFESIMGNKLISSIIAIIIGIVIYEIVHRIIVKNSQRTNNSRFSNRSKTYFRVLTSIIRSAFIIIIILTVLQINGINVNSFLAGAGILGIVIGFAVQDALKDIIRGITILNQGYFSVGDVVKYNDLMGKVISIGLSTTKIQDIITMNIISIANRNIEQIEVVSESNDVMVPMPYELSVDRAEEVIKEIVDEIKKSEDILGCLYKGVSKFRESNIDYYINFYCEPIKRRQVSRDVNRIILKALERNNISIPYNQIDIHQK